MIARIARCWPVIILLLAAPLTGESLFVNYTESDGLVADDSKCIVIGPDGKVWVGARGGGASVYDGTQFYKYTSLNSALNESPIKNMFIDSEQRVWFCQGYGGVVMFDGTIWLSYGTAFGLVGSNTFMAAETEEGTIYVVSESGLATFIKGVWSNYNVYSGLAENWLNYVFVDRGNTIWLGNKTKGVSHGHPQTGWTTTDWADDGRPTETRVIAEDLQNNLWIGTRLKGVVRYDGIEWKTFTTADGLGSDNVWGIAVDSSGGMWFATYGGGLSHFDGSHWDTYTNEDAGNKPISWNWLSGVAVAADSSIWFVNDFGVSYLPKANIRSLVSKCDVNADGQSNVVDVMALLLIQRRNSSGSRADYDGDGTVSTTDVIELLQDIRSGACP